MPNKKYQAGYRFEKRTVEYLNNQLGPLTNIKYNIVESRGSKGIADIMCGVYNMDTGERFWFGVQCKKGYISRPQMKRDAYRAMKEKGMMLYHATLDTRKNFIMTPEFSDWIELHLTIPSYAEGTSE